MGRSCRLPPPHSGHATLNRMSRLRREIMAREGAREETGGTEREHAPSPEDGRKPDGPPDLTKRSWTYTAKAAFAEFGHDQCTDLAAALTYYSVLALFPGLLAL